MVQKYIALRDLVHRDYFRLKLEPELWQAIYLKHPGVSERSIVRVEHCGVLTGFAVCAMSELKPGVNMCQVLEIVAESPAVMDRLMDQVTARATELGADFISLANYERPIEKVLERKQFIDFTSFAVMVNLLNPRALLRSLSDDTAAGPVLRLEIAGFEPLDILVAKNKIKLVEKVKAHVNVQMPDKIFLNIMFGKISFVRAFIKGRIKISGLRYFRLAQHFFNMIRQKKLYIPVGDGI